MIDTGPAAHNIGVVIATLSTAVKKRRSSRRARQRGMNSVLIQATVDVDEDDDSASSLFERVSVAVWYPGSYILVASIFLEGIVASIVRLFVIGVDVLDVVLAIIGVVVITQIQYRAWESVSKCFHGAGPVRFCACYVRVTKKYHESICNLECGTKDDRRHISRSFRVVLFHAPDL